MSYRRAKLGFFLFLGSILMAFGAALASGSDLAGNISATNAFTSFLLSVMMFFFGGLMFAMVAAAVRKSD
jgi:membrane-bound ClpP family serine protease